jgi:hypothetical protein
MPSPTAGFQLSALPETLSIPTNVGRYDVSQSQLAQANAMKNVQAASLIGPETRALIADAQKKRLEAQNAAVRAQALSSFVSPAAQAEARAAIAASQSGMLKSQLESAQSGAQLPGAGKLAGFNQQSALTRAQIAAESPTGVNIQYVDAGNGIKVAGVFDGEGKFTAIGGAGMASNLATKTVKGVTYVPKGAPFSDGTSTWQTWIRMGVDPLNRPVPMPGEIVKRVDQGPPDSSEFGEPPPSGGKPLASLGVVGIPSKFTGGPSSILASIPSANSASPVATPVAPATPAPDVAAVPPVATPPPEKPKVAAPWLPNPVDATDHNAVALSEINAAAKKTRGVPLNKVQQADRAKLASDVLDVTNNFSGQSAALNNAARAFENLKSSSVPPGPLNAFLPANLLAVLGLDGAQDFDSAMTSLVEKSTGGLKNIRAYQGIKDLLISAKPRRTDTPRVIAMKMDYMASLMNKTLEQSGAMGYALGQGALAQDVELIAARNYKLGPKDSYAAYVSQNSPGFSGTNVNDFVASWRHDNPNGTKAEAEKAWEALQSAGKPPSK